MKNKTKRTSKDSKPFISKTLVMSAAGVIVLAAAVYFLFIGGEPDHKSRLKNLNVILITLDTLRADYVSAYEPGNADTPNLDKAASDGVLFERCIAQSPLTLPSHTSILSGTYPLHHQIRDNGGFLVPDNLELISEVLKKKGYATSAFIASYVLHSKWGIDQGFDTYSDDFDLSRYEKISLGNVQKPAGQVLKDARQWLTEHKDKKFFTWIHLYDPHTPYEPPPPFKEKYPRRPYRGEVEYTDYELGGFFQFLDQQKISSNTLIIIAADHGEGLGQHDERTHGFFIYDTTVHVPLIIRAPFKFPVQRVKDTVELIDIAPTILDALQIPVPQSYQGESLLGLMTGKNKRKKKNAYTETYYPRLHFGWSELKALYYDNGWKYIQAPKHELYDVSVDKNEADNLALKKSYQATKAKQRIERFIRQHSATALKPGQAKRLDKEALQKLAALGYLTTVVDTKGKERLPDPKGKVEVFNQLSKAKEWMVKKEYDKAINLLEKILKTDPNLIDGILHLGNAYSRKKDYKNALKYYYEVLERKPDYQAAMINVINSLVRMGNLEEGIKETKRFLKTFPRDYSLFNELGTIYYMNREYDNALKAYRQSIEIEKTNPHAFNRLAGVYIIKKQFAEAAELLEKAESINPGLRKLNYHKAQVAEARGNIPQAMAFYKKELEHYPSDFKSAYNLAEELRKTGRYPEAIPYYRQSMESNPDFNIPYCMIAKYYLDRRENLEEARTLCEKAIAIKPGNKYTAFAHLILSDLFSFQQDPDAAKSHYRQAQEIKTALVKQGRW